VSHPLRSYLEIRSASPTSFSSDGQRILVSSNLTGTEQLYRVGVGGGPPEALTAEPERVNGMYLPGRDDLLVSIDAGGNERHQLYLLADAPGAALRPLVVEDEFIHWPGGASHDGRLVAYASNRRNGVDFDVYVRPVDQEGDSTGGGDRCLFASGGWCQPAGFSPDGRWLAVLRLTERNGDNDLYLVDLTGPPGPESVRHVSRHDDEATFGAPAWLGDSSGFYFATDTGRDVTALARYDLARGGFEYVLERPFGLSCAIDRSGRRLLLTTNEDGYTRAELLDPTTLASLGEVPLPGRGIAGFVFSGDGDRLAYQFTSATEPGDVWSYEIATGTTTRLTTSPRDVPPAELVEPELGRYRSFDGEEVPVFLYRPPGASGPAPVIVWVHGGPEAQFQPGFNPIVQYLVSQGYAVAAPNVRGSTGYGKRWHHLDDVRRRLDSVADVGSLQDWLAADAGLDASRAALVGASYGGYMVMAGLTLQPERWAAGVTIVGISSLVTFLENTSPWRRAFREREYGSLADDRDFLLQASPLTHLDHLRAPLFIIHGENDPRVPVTEARQLHAALSARGIPVELVVYPDEGHGLAKLANRLDAWPRAVSFLDGLLRPGQ
jgi:dipeptidyl aminopeptidase/acylaminoacyl peptidase